MKLLETIENREALLDAMVHNALDGIIVIDAHEIVHAWNPEAERIFGWPSEEAVGKALNALVGLSGLSMGKRRDAGFDPSKRMHAAARHKDGKPLTVELAIASVDVGAQTLFCIAIRDMTLAMVAEARLRNNHAQLKQELDACQRMLDTTPDVICAINASGAFVQVSAASQRLWGYAATELIGRPAFELVHPEDRKKYNDTIRRLCLGETTSIQPFENRFVHQDGHPIHVSWTANWSESDQHLYCVARDITELRHSTRRLAEREQRFESLFEHHPDGVFAFDINGNLISANKAFAQLTGYSAAELSTMSLRAMVAPESLKIVDQHFIEATEGNASSFETMGLRKDHSKYDAHITVVPIIVDDAVVGVHGVARDVTHSKDYERRIEHLATYDGLTGLPNRNLLDDRIKHAIVQAERQGGRVGVLFLDLNRFKIVNDSLGHDKGDILLRIMADRLKQCIRESDTVARLGGDEFVIVLEDVRSPEDVIGIARNLLTVIEKPVTLEGHDFSVSSSIGCSLYPKDGNDAATLLRNADLAMYEAKASGGGSFRFYKADMNERVKARLMHERQLRLALEREELVVYYQPRVDINSNKIVGAEALVRWHHPERGLVPPNEFIPLAEEVGLINELGEWVLKTACQQNRFWQEAGLPGLKVSVNLSPYQLAPDSTITHAVRKSLTQSGLDARWLELEITESSLMQNVESTLTKLAEIRDAGVSISIDDFGTGYSSLSYLRRLPVDTLKIDQSFIRDISGSRDDAAIVSATIALAHTMQLKVVAEGVTSEEQIRFLEEHDCDEMQGFFLSPAVPPDEMQRLLHRGRAPSVPRAHR
ncbi:EAL domain-containing protein [Herbaspirillum sp. GCM10030257]|uniref:sensor domain-containing protein n=1 Tax=Herbaspirillum sp. GCM10030257 TaxID=3273393 RepID=UPI00360D9E4C